MRDAPASAVRHDPLGHPLCGGIQERGVQYGAPGESLRNLSLLNKIAALRATPQMPRECGFFEVVGFTV
ncbi:MAG: hypothetical protein Kow00129_15200 [Thermoleophilia bacterium]